MRIRASVALVTGALALTALAAPTAQAADPSAGLAAKVTSFASVSPKDDSTGDTKISNVVVNGGKAVVLGSTTKKSFTLTFTASDDSGIDWAFALLWHGSTFEKSDNGALPNEGDKAKCTVVDSTTVSCKETFTVDAKYDLLNTNAGAWKVWVVAQAKDTDYVQKDNAKSFSLQRASKLTADATPEPVKKGKTLTVKGRLTRANWDTNKDAGYSGQSVKLQFRKKGSSAYTTVKTVKTDSKGNLKTTVKASVDGYYRYSFAGTSTTPAVNAAGDFVQVKK
ncbi:DUF5707 domain-containing protein [Streptomyces nodosus]|uniref:DUF5707 domain-containing protein n=1 Tax=Streptomyces nodosus TaxID=40318 RepID=UPI003451A802